MTKKMKVILGVVAVLLIGCIGGLGYTTWMMWNEMNTSRNEIAKLEDSAKEASEKVTEAEKEIKKAKKDAKTQREKAEDLQLEIKELQTSSEGEGDETTDVVETVVTATPAPTATEAPTVDRGPIEPAISFGGEYTEQGSGRVRISILDLGNYNYNVHIEGSDSATSSSFMEAPGSYDYDHSGIVYSGTLYENTYSPEGEMTTTSLGEVSGLLSTDHSTGTTLLRWDDWSGNSGSGRLFEKTYGEW